MTNKVGMDSPKVATMSAVDGSTSTSDTGAPEAAGLLPEPAHALLGGDSIAEIAALLAESACNDRKTARKEEIAQNIAAENETHARVAEMRKKADDMRGAAIASGVAGMVAGATSVVGAGLSLRQIGKVDLSPSTDAAKAANSAALAAGQTYGQAASGLSSIDQGVGSLVSGIFQANGQDHDAAAATHEQSAARDTRMAGQHADDASAARDQMNRVMDFLKSVRESQNATARSAIKG